MIDFIVDNSKIIFVILISNNFSTVSIQYVEQKACKGRSTKEIRKASNKPRRNSFRQSDTELRDAQEIVNELKENIVGTEGTMKDISDLESFLNSITNNIYHLK